MGVLRTPLITLLCLWLLFLQPSSSHPVRKALADASNVPDNCQQVRVDVQPAPKPLMESLTRAVRLKPEPAFVVSASGASKDIFESVEIAAGVEVCPAAAACRGDVQRGPNLVPASSIHAVIREKPQDREYPQRHLFFIVGPSVLELGVGCSNLSLYYTCGSEKGNVVAAAGQCWSVSIKDLSSHKKSRHHLHPRSIDTIPNLSSSPQLPSQHSFPAILVASVLLLVGVVALVAVVPLCTHGSQTFETQMSPSKQRSSDEVAQQPADSGSVTLKVGSRSDVLTNGSLTAKENKQQDDKPATRENGEPVSQQGSSTPTKKTRSASTGSGSGGQRSPRERSHSGWEQLPLPDVPKLEPAEDQPPEKKNTEPQKAKEGSDDEAGYAYAIVAKEDKMEGSDSEGEDREKPERMSEVRQNIPLRYGKVTRCPDSTPAVPEAEPEGDSYTEVRQFPPAILKGRLRSRTEPVDPADVVVNREKRAFTTHSAAHLPLPSIPGAEMDSQMYDIIPESIKTTSVAKVDPVRSKPALLKKKRERLYETVDDIGDREPDDTYDSIPDEIRHIEVPISPKTPPVVTVVVPSPSIQHTGIPIIVPQPPLPPESPIPRKEGKKEEDTVKKKKLSKMTSETDHRKKKSLFGRKKAHSISVPKTKKEKDQQKPLPDIPIPAAATHTPPTHVSPPAHLPPPPMHFSPPGIPPPLPPEDDEDEDDATYDRPQLDYPRSASESDGSPAKRISVEESKMKSQSLPMAMRSAGHTVFHPRPHLPLPDLPEDSGSGAVAVGVVLRTNEVDPRYPGYNVVVRDTDEEVEVPYETVNRDEVFAALERKQDADEPPYDHVKKLLDGDEPPYDSVKKPATEEERPYDSVKKSSTGEEEEPPYDSVKGKEGPEGAVRDAGYGKVTSSATSDPHGEIPEHDELGYAVIPAEAKKRKHDGWGITPEDLEADDDERDHNADRRFETEPEPPGDDSTPRPKDPGYEPVKKLEEATTAATVVEDTYAQVDMVAKRLSQRRRKQQQLKEQNPVEASIDEGVQLPPPVPPAADLGVDLSEFEEPPVPAQSENMLIMVEKGDPPYSKVLKVPKNGVASDPPYAKVIKERPPSDDVVRPYASFNVIEDADDSTAAGYDVVSKQAALRVEAQSQDSALGYDTVGVVSKNPNSLDPQDLKDAALGYDSIGDQLSTENATVSTSTVTIKAPTLVPAEPPQHMYDSLEGVLEPEVEPDFAAGNMYDCLLPQSGETESKSDDEDRYEEIDEDVRMHLLKMHRHLHTS